MGQITSPSPQALILTALDRLVAANAGGGMSPGAAHVIALGEDAGLNMGSVSGVIALGEDAGRNLPATANNTIFIGQNSGTAVQPPGVIVMGAGTLNGGLSTAGESDDTMAIGNRIATNLVTVNSGTDPTNPTSPLMIGSDIARSYTATNIQNFLAIGRNILPVHSSTSNGVGPQNSIMLGSEIKTARNTSTGSDGNQILIGHGIYRAMTLGIGGNHIAIGNNILSTSNGGGFSGVGVILIGSNMLASASNATTYSDAIAIGHSITFTSPNNTTAGITRSVYIGSGQEANSQTQSVQIGYGNTSPGTNVTRSQNNVIIGYSNNMRLGVWSNSVLIGDSNTEAGIGNGTMIYGDIFALSRANNSVLTARFSDGNIVLGRGANYAMGPLGGSTNCVYLRNGTGSGTLPTGGGYFYVTGGNLHWVSSGGYDCTLTPAAGQLAATVTGAPYANGAGVAAATLTNAPAAGDPTKWIPIDDNGTTRYIPAW